MREDLASMGSPPSEDEFYVIILGSLPSSYDPYISALNATLIVLGYVLSSDDLIQMKTDEYEHHNLGRGSKKEDNVAFSANDEIVVQPQDTPKKTKMVPEAGKEGKEIVVNIGVEPRTTIFAAAALTEEGHGSPTVDIDLFDSGVSRHMSGHCHRFVDFTKIKPRPIMAALAQ